MLKKFVAIKIIHHIHLIIKSKILNFVSVNSLDLETVTAGFFKVGK